MFKRTAKFLVVTMLVMLPAQVFATTLTNVLEVKSYTNSNIVGSPSGSAIINGQEIGWFFMNGNTHVYIVPPGGSSYGLVESADSNVIVSALASFLGFTSVSNIANPNSPSATAMQTVTNIVLPAAKTANERKKAAAVKAIQPLKLMASGLSTEFYKNAGEHGQVYGVTLGMAYDIKDFTIGVVMPYQRSDANIFDGDRIGTIFYGQYTAPLSKTVNLSLIGNVTYVYTDLKFTDNSHSASNMYGGGISTRFEYSDNGIYSATGLTLQYNTDDTINENNKQTLVKVGTNLGFDITQNQVVSANIAYTRDVSSYTNDINFRFRDYFEVGAEYRFSVSDTWALNLGYKKTLGIYDYRSDYVYLGSTLNF